MLHNTFAANSNNFFKPIPLEFARQLDVEEDFPEDLLWVLMELDSHPTSRAKANVLQDTHTAAARITNLKPMERSQPILRKPTSLVAQKMVFERTRLKIRKILHFEEVSIDSVANETFDKSTIKNQLSKIQVPAQLACRTLPNAVAQSIFREEMPVILRDSNRMVMWGAPAFDQDAMCILPKHSPMDYDDLLFSTNSSLWDASDACVVESKSLSPSRQVVCESPVRDGAARRTSTMSPSLIRVRSSKRTLSSQCGQ